MPVVNEKKLCARRDNSYNMLNVQKPEQTANGQWICPPNDDGDKLKLCGEGQALKFMFCIPEKNACPITGIKYEGDKLVTLSEAA